MMDARSADASSATRPADCEVYASDMMPTRRRSSLDLRRRQRGLRPASETISVKRNGKSLAKASPTRS
jgi:hypothetical protein